ncbi:MAG: hypothetical protein IPL04_17605 [Chitinophagaceae bacterium]|nr:hypothetical protein [Chitinophagaceae bacterium]
MAEIIQEEGKQKGGKKKAKKVFDAHRYDPHGRPDVFADHLFHANNSLR